MAVCSIAPVWYDSVFLCFQDHLWSSAKFQKRSCTSTAWNWTQSCCFVMSLQKRLTSPGKTLLAYHGIIVTIKLSWDSLIGYTLTGFKLCLIFGVKN